MKKTICKALEVMYVPLVRVAVFPEGREVFRCVARVCTIAVTKLAEEIGDAVPGLVGEVPQVDAIGHVRPDFRRGTKKPPSAAPLSRPCSTRAGSRS